MKQNQQPPSSSSEAVQSTAAAAASSIATADDLISRDGAVTSAETIVVERRGEFAAVCRWTVNGLSKTKAKALWSKYFEVGGYDCRLLVYPKGDSQALPGYVSVYLQIMDPRGPSSSKWDCFASYQLTIVNYLDDSKSVERDSWHRFSSKKKSHGWCDFTPSSGVFDPKMGFLFDNDSVLIAADIVILNESVSFVRDNNNSGCSNNEVVSGVGMLPPVVGAVPDVLCGKFTWKVHNFSLFKEMIKTQKIMSPLFPSGECKLRISVYQSTVNGVDYLSMCLESKDSEKVAMLADRSCWCLFRMSVLNQKPGLSHMHKDSYGRFAADNKGGDSTSLGWNDYMRISDFLGPESGFLVDDTAVFSTSFHVIKEFSSFSKNGGNVGGRNGAKKMDSHMGKLTWRIDNFTRLKDILKKRKITGLCIKSRRFQIGNRDCRLIVYPRGQSQPPCYLSVFLEVTDSRNISSDWSCFVSHRLSVVNQKTEEKSVSKESQNRYSKAAKDWGWREFVTLTSLFDQDSGFLVQDAVVFTAEVLILKETSTVQEFTDHDNELTSASSSVDVATKRSSFTWKVENFLAFKEIMGTRKIFSKFFQAAGCELRIGVYESVDTICLYLESDQSVGSDPDKNFWVKYRMAVVNQKNPTKNVWKESSLCTKTWNNSVLQYMKVSDILEADAGFLVRDSVVFVCEVLDCCPWFDFSDLEVLASEDDQDALTDPDELIDSDESEGLGGEEEDIFRNLLSRAGFHLTCGDSSAQPEVTLREKLLMDAGAIAGFLTGLRVYLDDPTKVKRLLLPTKLSGNSSPSLINLLMGVKVLQQAIIDILLDIMVECCQSLKESCGSSSLDASSKSSLDGACAASPLKSDRYNNATASAQVQTPERFDTGMAETLYISAIQSSDVSGISVPPKATLGQPTCPPETTGCGAVENPTIRSKTKWPEQSEELLRLIVNSLSALDGAVPQGCPEPRRRPQSAQKIGLVLDKAPKHLQSDLIALVPKLVERAEHSLAAYSLIERLKTDAEPALRILVFDALGQLECSNEVWEQVLLKSFELLIDINDEPLAETIDFLFKAASQCQDMPLAVRAIRVRLKSLGADVAPCVLDYLGKIVNTWGDVAETILKDIDCDEDFGEMLIEMGEQAFHTSYHFSDICIVIEILSIPCLAAEASQTFERAVSKGAFLAQSVAMVLERRFAQSQNLNSRSAANVQHPNAGIEREASDHLRAQQDEFTSLLGLAEMLTLSSDPCVRSFVKALYTILSKWYMDESHREQMLKRLVDRALSTTDNNHEIDLDFEILVLLVSEQEIGRPVFSMMREVAKLANVDRAALWHQLCANEEEIIHMREESKAEISSLEGENAALSQKLSESEASNSHVKSEMRAEMDNFAREKKELSEHIQKVENQHEWIRAERGDEVVKLAAEKKVLQDRIHDAENQLSQLKSRNRDELKKVTKEKNALAERLKSAEAARKRFDDELKRYATENVTREEIRKSLEDEVQRLTETVGQTGGEKRDKEKQVARCEAYIDVMDSRLQACQQYIHMLKVSLQEEMSKHAPLYGVGLEALSMNELETLASIHEDGLRQIHALQQRKGISAVSPLMNPLILPYNHGLYSTSTPLMTVGLPAPLIPSGAVVHSNGNINGAVGPWFKHT